MTRSEEERGRFAEDFRRRSRSVRRSVIIYDYVNNDRKFLRPSVSVCRSEAELRVVRLLDVDRT